MSRVLKDRAKVGALTCAVIALVAGGILTGHAAADPGAADGPPPPLPEVTVTPSNWAPKYPYPYDKMKNSVTASDIAAQGEMCQWYNAQYDLLVNQIDRFNVDLITSDGRWDTPGLVEKADAVTSNIDQALSFLAPRAQALTISKDFAGNLYFPLYQGESFYRLWEQLSNVNAGIKGRQPAWFVGPSYQHAMRMGSKINRSHVCR